MQTQTNEPQPAQFFCLHEEGINSIYQHRILDSLKFELIHQRDEKVHDPYDKTFQWIFEDGDTSTTNSDISLPALPAGQEEESDNSDNSQPADDKNEDDDECEDEDERNRQAMMAESRQRLLNWLALSDKIFHVTGKLGSGKSTLMKFLYSHPTTKGALKGYAGEKDIILARFFFWNPGTDLQNSINGMYRSLLYDILKACPSLIQHALPSLWDQAQQAPWQCQGQLDTSAKAIRDSLEKILTDRDFQCRLFERHRFCFFIGGLDEHEEIPNHDHIYLAKLLNGWVTVQFKPSHIRMFKLRNEEIWLELKGKKKVTLRQWIEAIDLKDKSYILHLLDRGNGSKASHMRSIDEVTLDPPQNEHGKSDAVTDGIADNVPSEKPDTSASLYVMTTSQQSLGALLVILIAVLIAWVTGTAANG
ncbi:hypothetical protein Forpe1208_v000105 [Fusarium oxysporum f. sp. rapae]|uniref:Nephrocystin 3-like N-terminal domain-containing protein n=1 Tax=Fusarium oxysporum f. sp. rapae TaxID=485398 RepID=A0A8J5PL93_FUSOX|nr:hypothetical protein Forpe1208_v000105 [Fusarium oxysporum f. sp. rapae]